MTTVEITPRGGLGNQLFTWAAGLAVARRTGADLVADPSMIEADSRYELQLNTFASGVKRLGQRWTMRGPLSRLPHRFDTFREESFRFDPRILEASPPVRLEGYFQSWMYFADIEGEVAQRCLTMTAPSQWYVETESWIRQLPAAPVVVNLRFGDYLTARVSEGIGMVTADYFNRGIELVRDHGHRGRVLAFSDEPDRVMQFLGRGDVTVVRAPESTARVEQLALMSLGSAHVIANSTFSWWGATLARQRVGALTVAPDPWFRNLPHDTKDLLWPDWVVLSRAG